MNPASTPPIERPRGRSGEELVALMCLALVLCADLAMVRLGLDPEDEGYFVEQTMRLLQSQLPYRDFDSLYTPALLYIHATIVTVFGGSPIVDLRIVGLLARLVLAVGLYLLCRPVVRPAIAVLPSLYVLVALDRIPGTWEPHPAWPSAALTVLAMLAFTRLPPTCGARRNVALIAIGAIAALVFALKQNAGVLLGLALVVSTAWQGIDHTRTEVSRTLHVIRLFLLVAVVAAGAQQGEDPQDHVAVVRGEPGEDLVLTRQRLVDDVLDHLACSATSASSKRLPVAVMNTSSSADAP